jgi:hypothetical protein
MTISIALILPPSIVNTNAARTWPPAAQTAPGSPSTSAGTAARAAFEDGRNSRCSVLFSLQNRCSVSFVRGGHAHGQIIGTQHHVRR